MPITSGLFWGWWRLWLDQAELIWAIGSKMDAALNANWIEAMPTSPWPWAPWKTMPQHLKLVASSSRIRLDRRYRLESAKPQFSIVK